MVSFKWNQIVFEFSYHNNFFTVAIPTEKKPKPTLRGAKFLYFMVKIRFPTKVYGLSIVYTQVKPFHGNHLYSFHDYTLIFDIMIRYVNVVNRRDESEYF